MIAYQSSPSTWTSSQALAHFGVEMISLNSINKPHKGPHFFKRLRGLIKKTSINQKYEAFAEILLDVAPAPWIAY